MANAFYNSTGNPGTRSPGLSATIRAEFAAIAAGFDKLPSTFIANRPVVVNAGGTALTLAGGGLILAGDLTTSGAFNTTLVQQATVTLTLPAVNGTLATLAGTETLTNKTLTSPSLSDPTVTGALTYGGVTLTNAVTGTGKMVLDTAPTLSNPVVGTQAFGDNSTKAASTAYADAAISEAIPTGTVVPYVGTTAPSGFVLASGGTIGDGSSGATERANADTEDLFILWWNSTSNAAAPVSGGRGASAAADFAAHKTITLPDLRGRVVAGLDGGTSRLPGFTDPGVTGGAQIHSHSVSGSCAININSGTTFDGTVTLAAGVDHNVGNINHRHNVSGNGSISGTGAGTTNNSVQPTMSLNYIIRL